MDVPRGLVVAALAVAALGCAGCGSDRDAAARDVGQRFYAALQAGDGEGACRLLAPGTVEELEDSAREGCADAVLEAGVPAPGRTLGATVYGDQGQLRSESDMAFVAQFPEGWRVTAAGCEPQGTRPYDCALKGD